MNQASMNQASTKSKIKLNRRGLAELMLGCAFLSLLTFALWSWQNGGRVLAADEAAIAVPTSLLPMITRHPAIMLSVIVTEFIVLLALVLTFVPITWWLRTDAVLPHHQARTSTPLRWLGEKLHLLPPAAALEEEIEGEYIITETGERIFVPYVDPEMEEDQEVVMVEQEDGTLLAMVQQEDGTMVPAPTKSKAEGAGGEESTEPLLPLPEQTSDVLNFEEEEEDPLADLADIGDILNSAFDEDSAVDPEREAISRSLEEVDVMDLLHNARHVLATFKQ